MTGDSRLAVGIDFDNTLVSYDELMWTIARERGLIPAEVAPTKRAVRDHIRAHAGDEAWQRVQAAAYGPRIDGARLIDGVPEFFAECRARGVRPVVVSHKTRHSNLGEEPADLRWAATRWMAAHKFFGDDGLGLREDDVFFESTRPEKVARIAELGCSHFIDDLEETFAEPSFPAGVTRILFAPHGAPATPGVTVCRSWDEITAQVLDGVC